MGAKQKLIGKLRKNVGNVFAADRDGFDSDIYLYVIIIIYVDIEA
jgi:hypothetical protein